MKGLFPRLPTVTATENATERKKQKGTAFVSRSFSCI